jgi:uncharacterized protein (UPF0333 family)
MNKKAQSALEYLLTYGWAILIVIIVGASLYALGVFNPGTFTGKRTTGFTQFQLVDQKVDTNTNVTLVFGNRLGKTVSVGNVTATYKNIDCTGALPGGVTTMGPNTQLNVTIPCKSKWGALDLRTSYSIIIDIAFHDPDSGLDHLDTGSLFGAVESP